MKARRNALLFTVIIILGTTYAVSGEAEKLLSKVEKSVREARTLEIVFEEQFVWKMTGEESVLNGTLKMSGDDKFRIETEDQILVSNGEKLWTYSKPANRVLIDRLAESDEALLPRQLLLRYTEGYTVEKLPDETVNKRPCIVLLFRDEEAESYYAKWQVWIDPDTFLPVKLMQEDLNGNQNIYHLNSVKKGVVLNDDLFQFTIPDSAEVIEM
ncbi:outer membrane lipoprotein carrier protein LolA [bacterium]|nr:outer membrane lipoprotein carrier protein LolA [bacterium]